MSAQPEVKQPWESLDLQALSQAIADKNDEQRSYYKANKDRWDDDERITIFENRNKELKSMIERQSKLQKIEENYQFIVENDKAMKQPAEHVPFESKDNSIAGTITSGASGKGTALKSLDQVINENKALKSIGMWEDIRTPMSFVLPDFMFDSGPSAIKTVMTRAAGYAPPNDRTGLLVPYAQREPRLADLIPVVQTNLGTIKYMETTTALAGTNAQVSIAEGNLKFENTLAFTERSAPVETVGTFLPVTTQQLDDVQGIQGIIESEMSLFLQLKEEDLLLNGTGTTPQLIGFQGAGAPNVLTQARGVDTNIDAVFKAIQQIRVTGLAEPDGVVMHPDNFTPIALYKATSGEYGFDVTVDNGGVVRLWGKPLILSPVATVGTALVGAFRTYSRLWRRMGMTIQVGLNADDFTKNKRTILGEFREALTITRQTAFAEVTGLQ